MTKDSLINMSISILSLIFILLVLELGTRVLHSEYDFVNFLELTIGGLRGATPAEFSSELGWAPRSGYMSTTVNILDDGTRSNGSGSRIPSKEIILAVGDSFTFGDQVSDDETWPALLEKRSDSTVINGGVFGYGTDQTYIRMTMLAEAYQPRIIIFSLIPNDIGRSQDARRNSTPKPYFELSDNNELVLIDQHVIPPEPGQKIDIIRRTLGYSLFAHRLLKSLFPDYWINGTVGKTQVNSKGVEITCRLFEHLKDYALRQEVDIYVLFQYSTGDFEEGDSETEAELKDLNAAAECIDEDVIELVDLYKPLSDLKEHNPDYFQSLFDGHMTKAGNDFVSSIMWARLGQKGVFTTAKANN